VNWRSCFGDTIKVLYYCTFIQKTSDDEVRGFAGITLMLREKDIVLYNFRFY